MFSRSGWSIVRSALLAKGGTLKKRLSPHLHKVLTWSNKVSPLTLQIALTLTNYNKSTYFYEYKDGLLSRCLGEPALWLL
jgi:hypothetical protein